jgi:cell division ATPase FtsA
MSIDQGRPPRHALGVDFGTSNTVAVARWPDGRARPILIDGSPLLPSAVYAEPNGQLIVGRDAVHSARLDPARFEPNPKRRIDDGKVLLGEHEVPVGDLIAAVLARVAEEWHRAVGPVRPDVTLTCPATWGATRRTLLAEAAAGAGLEGARLVAEPVAAATYFAEVLGRDVPIGSVVMVHDFGAGTFDASVVARTAEGFEVLAVDGRDDIGGLDVDAAIVEHLGTLFTAEPDWERLSAPTTVEERRAQRQLWDDVRIAKERLSRTQSADLVVPLLNREVHLTRDELETLARPVLDQTVQVTRSLLRWADLPEGRLAGVFLVGGASRIPLVATLLHRALGEAPVVIEQPELVVAEGSILADAAMLASGPAAPGLTAEFRLVASRRAEFETVRVSAASLLSGPEVSSPASAASPPSSAAPSPASALSAPTVLSSRASLSSPAVSSESESESEAASATAVSPAASGESGSGSGPESAVRSGSGSGSPDGPDGPGSGFGYLAGPESSGGSEYSAGFGSSSGFVDDQETVRSGLDGAPLPPPAVDPWPDAAPDPWLPDPEQTVATEAPWRQEPSTRPVSPAHPGVAWPRGAARPTSPASAAGDASAGAQTVGPQSVPPQSAGAPPTRSGSRSGRSGSTRSGSVRSGSAQSGPAQPGSAQAGSGQAGSAQAGSARSGSARSGSARSGSAQPGSAQPGSAGSRTGSSRSGRSVPAQQSSRRETSTTARWEQQAAPRQAAARPAGRRRRSGFVRFIQVLLSIVVLIAVPLAAMVFAYSYGTGQSLQDAATNLVKDLEGILRNGIV